MLPEPFQKIGLALKAGLPTLHPMAGIIGPQIRRKAQGQGKCMALGVSVQQGCCTDTPGTTQATQKFVEQVMRVPHSSTNYGCHDLRAVVHLADQGAWGEQTVCSPYHFILHRRSPWKA